jgi:hypothetical protein
MRQLHGAGWPAFFGFESPRPVFFGGGGIQTTRDRFKLQAGNDFSALGVCAAGALVADRAVSPDASRHIW